MVSQTLVLALCFLALGHAVVIEGEIKPSSDHSHVHVHDFELIPKSDVEFQLPSFACMSRLISARKSSCKRALEEKFEQSKIKEKFLPVMLSKETFTEEEKDYICCFNEKEYQCIKDQAKDVCEGDLPGIKDAANEMTAGLLHLDCSKRPLRCENTGLDGDTSLVKASESDNSLLISMVKGLNQKSDDGFSKLSTEIKAVQENVENEYKKVSDKLDRILLSLGNKVSNNEVEDTDP